VKEEHMEVQEETVPTLMCCKAHRRPSMGP